MELLGLDLPIVSTYVAILKRNRCHLIYRLNVVEDLGGRTHIYLLEYSKKSQIQFVQVVYLWIDNDPSELMSGANETRCCILRAREGLACRVLDAVVST